MSRIDHITLEDLQRRPCHAAAPRDTLRDHAEEMMSLTAGAVLCGRLFSALSDYVAAYPGASLETVGTGGGCTAWEATLIADERQTVVLMVTDENLSHPDCDTDPVSFCLYLRDHDGEDVLSRWLALDDVAEALEVVQSGFTGVTWTEGAA